ncbi:MAG: hypothetical protein ACLP8X_28085 [Streptosporangiaceae bacterium]
MSDKHEATVEVLTAEVRVLQVGRRQVTLSVVRQLDWADPADVEPFGRVRTGDNLPGRPSAIGNMGSSRVKQPAAVEVVGSASGVLVRSVSWRSMLTCTSGGASACPEAQALNTELDRFKVRGQPPSHKTPEYQRILDRFMAHEVHDWTRYDPDQRTYDAWQALPLIVLAGLK